MRDALALLVLVILAIAIVEPERFGSSVASIVKGYELSMKGGAQ